MMGELRFFDRMLDYFANDLSPMRSVACVDCHREGSLLDFQDL